MKRAPIVIVATIAGLAGIVTFHTKSAGVTLGGLPQTSATTRPSSTSTTAGSSSGKGSVATGPPGSTTPTTVPSTTSAPPPTTAPTTRRATGPLVNYNYGALSVSVTVNGKKITDVSIASLDDGGNFRSQSIDQQSLPILEQQAIQAQSANIQGVSGASFTSAGFQQSLQAALQKLGV